MRLNYLAYTFSLAMMYFSLMLFVPVLVALFYGETNAVLPFVTAGLTLLGISFILRKIVKGVSHIDSINDIKKSEGLCAVVLCWVSAGLFASIPYLFFGFSPTNAFFEATAGITATGATILTHFDYPKALFFWRSFSQWLGGMGIIVLFIAILPQFAIAGRQLFFAEAPGPTEEKFTPRIKNTASALWKVYFGMTLLAIFLLRLNGMELYDSVCNAFSAVSGGGFSPNSNSMIGQATPILWVMCFFMFFCWSKL